MISKRELGAAFAKINKLILERGHKWTEAQMNKALGIWDTLMKAQCDNIPEEALIKSHNSRPVVRAVSGGNPVRDWSGLFSRYRATPYNNPKTGEPWTGHQLAAIKAGLDPDTPGIEEMTYPEMCDLAQGRLKESVRPLWEAAGLHRNMD